MISKRLTYGTIVLLAAAALPAFAQVDIKAAFVKHLKTSKDFTLKVADQMPEATYNFKLTPPQMSFAEQMVHLSQTLDAFLSSFGGERPSDAKPATMSNAGAGCPGSAHTVGWIGPSTSTSDSWQKATKFSLLDGLQC